MDLVDLLYYGTLLILLLLISISDIKTYTIPKRYIITGIIWSNIFNILGMGIGFFKGIIGALIGGLSIIIISYISLLIFKKPGMAGGDVKLMAMAGFYLGWKNTLLSLLFGIYIAGIIAIFLLLKKKISKGDYIPFAPYLALGIVLSLIIGERIMNWYITLINF